ncbi:protein-arginine deiminase family protein [Capilliphycus salinus ALCB114379]|uniref:protein-arginine deiminase family protein n=1 Tax=Capilliphycus salinus TaxID=2768948 RepID=UPI0039A7462F
MRYVAVALINTVGAVVGIILIPMPQWVLAQSSPNTPEIEYRIDDSSLLDEPSDVIFPESSLTENEPPQPQSLEDLYRLRDQLKADLEKLSDSEDISSLEAWQYELQLQQYQTGLRALRQTETRIRREEEAAQLWDVATQQASQAVAAGKQNPPDWESAQTFWVQAIDSLRQIPSETFLTEKAVEKIVEYQGYLAIATYERAIVQSQQKDDPTPEKDGQYSVDVPQFPGFEMYGDTNRDGVINAADEVRPARWSLSTGPLMLFNNDDDDRDGFPDWKDQIVNGKYDREDLAQIHFKISPEYQGAEIFITTDTQAQPFVNIFQKTAGGWVPVDLTGEKALTFNQDMILGVEAKQFAHNNWTGLVSLKAVARRDNQEIASDTIQMGVAPWMMSPNTASVSEVHLSDRGENRELIAEVKQVVEPRGATPKITPGETAWMQDTTEIGYVQFPGENSLKSYPVALNGNRSGESDDYAESLMNRNFGWFEMGKPRSLDPLNQWLDWYSNLEVTPALPNYPMGRIYYGKADEETLHPDVVEFLKAQQVQGPPIEIDTSWLMVRHVSEIINFIPSQTGEPLLLIVSPRSGLKLIEELAEKGYEGAAINRGLSTQTTIRAALNNRLLVQHNLQLQREKIDPLLKKLKRELNLNDDQIIEVPVLFGYSGYAWWPNLVNAVFVNGELLVPNPRGALIDGRDYTQEDFKRRLAVAGLNVNFLNDSYYQELKGDVYTGINTTREASQQPFWEVLPQR